MTIKMSLKLSKETPQGWRGLELGAEASLAPFEDVTTAAPKLYAQLRSEFAKLWNANGITTKQQPRDDIEQFQLLSCGHLESENCDCNQEPEVQTTISVADEPHVTEKQIGKIFALAGQLSYANSFIADMCANRYGKKDVDYLTRSQASNLIDYLNEKLEVEAQRPQTGKASNG